MTKMFAVDENNDIYIARDGNLAINTGLLGVMEAAQQSAQAQLGEMVLAIDQGVPNFQTIWESAANVAQFEAYVRRAIMSVPGVLEIKEFSAVVQNNVVRYSATIRTTFGTGSIANVVT